MTTTTAPPAFVPPTPTHTARVTATPAALALIETLKAEHGPLLFHQSGGCCDGSAPMCYPLGDFKLGERDVDMGDVGGCPFYMGGSQYEYWAHTFLTVDVVPGRGSGFSAEAPHGVRFLIRSRLFSDEEDARIEAEGPLPRGPRPHA